MFPVTVWTRHVDVFPRRGLRPARESENIMKVTIPDYGDFNLPGQGGTVEEVRRNLVGLGFTQVQNAQATQLANGDIKFERATGGTKGC